MGELFVDENISMTFMQGQYFSNEIRSKCNSELHPPGRASKYAHAPCSAPTHQTNAFPQTIGHDQHLLMQDSRRTARVTLCVSSQLLIHIEGLKLHSGSS